MEEILLLANKQLSNEINEICRNINIYENDIKKYQKDIESFLDSNEYKRNQRNNESLKYSTERLESIKNELNKLEYKRKNINEKLKTECQHYFTRVCGENDEECVKCGWYKSEL